MKFPVRAKLVDRLPALLHELRTERHVSMRVLADSACVDVSVVSRAERGRDAYLSTWETLFDGLGYRLELDATEWSEEGPVILAEEAEARRERRRAGMGR
jgi:transcriptional regulator with XRE-family HTH domain